MTAGRTIKVCHLAPGDLWAGAEVQAAVLLPLLAKRPDLDVSAVVLNEGRLAAELVRSGIPTRIIPESRHGFVAISKQLARHFESDAPDILHTHKWKDNLLGAVTWLDGSVRCRVRTVHGSVEPLGGVKAMKMTMSYAVDNVVNRWAVDRILTVSRELTEDFTRRFGDRKVVGIHNGVDLARVVAAREAADLRRELGIAPDAIVIGTVGRLVPVKGLEPFLRAARLVRERRADLKVLIVGEGPSETRLHALSRDLTLEQNVLFLGHRADCYDLMALMDVFVLPSLSEGIPMALLEAMALSRPVVATRVGGIPEVIEHEVSGLLVDAGQDSALAGACLAMIDDRDRAQRLGIAARIRIEQAFTAQAMADRVAGLYCALAHEPPAADVPVSRAAALRAAIQLVLGRHTRDSRRAS